jgi:hypothetical protein
MRTSENSCSTHFVNRAGLLDCGFTSRLTWLSEGKLLKENALRKLLLLVGLSMMAVLVFTPAALAQPNGPAYDFIQVPNGIRPCPFGLERVQQDYQREVVCGEGGGYVFAPGGSASPSPSLTPSASPSPSPSASPSPSPSPSASPSPSPTATASPDASALPATGGGFSPALALGPVALIVGGGLLALRIVRR